MTATMPKTIVYIDAFNFFYGALKKTAYKWVDLEKLCRAYLPHNNIVKIKYFTAKASARPHDLQLPMRQQIYLRAISTLPLVEIIYGFYLTHNVRMPLSKPAPNGPMTVEVVKTEEKGSDVNLASHLLHDAHLNRFDIGVILSNDSDLLEPIKLIRRDLKKSVGILNPHKKPSRVLQQNADFMKTIRSGALANSQFPDQLTDEKGTFIKPSSWK